MFGVGILEILVIALVALIAFGAQELPIIMQKFAKLYREFLSLKEELSFKFLTKGPEEIDHGREKSNSRASE